MSITKTGVWTSNISNYTYLINNFTETKTNTDWTLSGSVNSSTGIATMSGSSPNFESKNITLNPTDILVVEFNLYFTTPSTSTNGPGCFIGTQNCADLNKYTWNTNTLTWGTAVSNANSSWDTYFISGYNSTDKIYIKSYIIGSSVDINYVPAPVGGNWRALQFTATTATNVKIQSRYNNGNTNMVFNVSNFKLYNLNTCGVSELNTDHARIFKGGINAPQFIEL